MAEIITVIEERIPRISDINTISYGSFGLLGVLEFTCFFFLISVPVKESGAKFLAFSTSPDIHGWGIEFLAVPPGTIEAYEFNPAGLALAEAIPMCADPATTSILALEEIHHGRLKFSLT
jgi:hypothetical protein